jgi:hypothetical protein
MNLHLMRRSTDRRPVHLAEIIPFPMGELIPFPNQPASPPAAPSWPDDHSLHLPIAAPAANDHAKL